MAAMKRFGQTVGGGSGTDVKTAKSGVSTSSSGTSKPTSSIAAKFGAGKSQSSSQPQHAVGSATGHSQSQSKTLSEKLGTSPADKYVLSRFLTVGANPCLTRLHLSVP
jgi:hypothetical protein